MIPLVAPEPDDEAPLVYTDGDGIRLAPHTPRQFLISRALLETADPRFLAVNGDTMTITTTDHAVPLAYTLSAPIDPIGTRRARLFVG